MQSNLKPIGKWTEDLLEKAITGTVTIHRHGEELRYKLTPAQRQEFEAAKARGFVYLSRSKADIALDNSFFRWCEIKQRPFVKVKRKTKLAAVDMDVIMLPNHDLSEGQKKAITDLFWSNAKLPTDFWVGNWTSCDAIFLESADRVALGLIRIWDDGAAGRAAMAA